MSCRARRLWTRSGQLRSPQDVDARKYRNLWRTAVSSRRIRTAAVATRVPERVPEVALSAVRPRGGADSRHGDDSRKAIGSVSGRLSARFRAAVGSASEGDRPGCGAVRRGDARAGGGRTRAVRRSRAPCTGRTGAAHGPRLDGRRHRLPHGRGGCVRGLPVGSRASRDKDRRGAMRTGWGPDEEPSPGSAARPRTDVHSLFRAFLWRDGVSTACSGRRRPGAGRPPGHPSTEPALWTGKTRGRPRDPSPGRPRPRHGGGRRDAVSRS